MLYIVSGHTVFHLLQVHAYFHVLGNFILCILLVSQLANLILPKLFTISAIDLSLPVGFSHQPKIIAGYSTSQRLINLMLTSRSHATCVWCPFQGLINFCSKLTFGTRSNFGIVTSRQNSGAPLMEGKFDGVRIINSIFSEDSQEGDMKTGMLCCLDIVQ